MDVASQRTGLLTARCDPFGAESQIKLLGGMYPESWVGNIMWHCQNPAGARYRMICTGGGYGERSAPDGGLVAAYNCPGGHQGVVMPLCDDHRRMIARRQSDLCPACAWPPRGRSLQAVADQIQLAMPEAQRRADWPLVARLSAQLDQVMAEFNELLQRGIVHKCPLRLVEVS